LCHGIMGTAFALEEPQRNHFLFYTTPESVRVGFTSGIVKASSDNSGLWLSGGGRSWDWMMADYDRSGLGDSIVDIGYPGVTNP